MDALLSKFQNKRSRSRKDMRSYANSVFTRCQLERTEYIDTGIAEAFERIKKYRDFDEDFRQWQLLTSELGVPEGHWGYIAQLTYIEKGVLAPEPLLRSAANGYYLTAVEYHRFCTSVQKTGSVVNTWWWSTITAFKLVPMLLAGLKSEADELYHANATAWRTTWVNRSHSFIGDFLVLLYGRYLGVIEPPFAAEIQINMRKTAPFPYTAILDNWDSPDTELVATMLQTLCDHQVEQAVLGGKKCYFEFNGGIYTYLPLTALLLMKLRALRGLANPQFSHPGFGDVSALFEQVSTAFSEYVGLHQITRIEDAADEELNKILARMYSQDFDAHAIFALNI
ncbi:hypothetical protein [Shewanella jiangmenensis]|uniref:hypothetical protein n=1 Tax=Shewanella jiangmenensis TaxID=2837387 RepID=UPI002032C330|nr:hypothetical protein [Shewanella jiangmenensis]